MKGTERTNQIAMEMSRYNLAVRGISETHWTGNVRFGRDGVVPWSRRKKW